jgi:hypothetical protein
MYRDPFNQVISSYNYHAQVPTPEKWIRKYTKPVMPSEHSARCDTSPRKDAAHKASKQNALKGRAASRETALSKTDVVIPRLLHGP